MSTSIISLRLDYDGLPFIYCYAPRATHDLRSSLLLKFIEDANKFGVKLEPETLPEHNSLDGYLKIKVNYNELIS